MLKLFAALSLTIKLKRSI